MWQPAEDAEVKQPRKDSKVSQLISDSSISIPRPPFVLSLRAVLHQYGRGFFLWHRVFSERRKTGIKSRVAFFISHLPVSSSPVALPSPKSSDASRSGSGGSRENAGPHKESALVLMKSCALLLPPQGIDFLLYSIALRSSLSEATHAPATPCYWL